MNSHIKHYGLVVLLLVLIYKAVDLSAIYGMLPILFIGLPASIIGIAISIKRLK